jgi:hypothetical protein
MYRIYEVIKDKKGIQSPYVFQPSSARGHQTFYNGGRSGQISIASKEGEN